MKGITPVVAIILLLMITISMVGFAFVWFSRMIETVSGGVENETEQMWQTMGKKIDVINLAPDMRTVSIRNIGTVGIPENQLSFFIDNAPAGCTFSPAGLTIAPGAVEECTLDTDCGDIAGERLKVTAPGNTAIYACS
jgi:flagellin-like protein